MRKSGIELDPKAIASELTEELLSARVLGFSVCLAVALVIMGPFGTFLSMPFHFRMIYWPVVVAASVLLSMLVHVGGRQAFPNMRSTWRVLSEAVVIATLLAPVVAVVTEWITLPDHRFWLTIGELWLIIASMFAMLRGSFLVAETDLDTDTADLRPRLYRRLPVTAKSSVIHLTVNDHYVLATLEDGQTHRLLMRLADAVDELDTVDGFCVHRSHWVLRSAIDEVYRQKGRDMLRLTSGTEIPISRTYRPNLVEAGLLPPRD